jgi:hypothetical protein
MSGGTRHLAGQGGRQGGKLVVAVREVVQDYPPSLPQSGRLYSAAESRPIFKQHSRNPLEVAQIASHKRNRVPLNDGCDFQIVAAKTEFASSKALEMVPALPVQRQDLNPRQELHCLLERCIGPKYLLILLGTANLTVPTCQYLFDGDDCSWGRIRSVDCASMVGDVLQEIVKIGMVFPDSGESDPGIALGRSWQRHLLPLARSQSLARQCA